MVQRVINWLDAVNISMQQCILHSSYPGPILQNIFTVNSAPVQVFCKIIVRQLNI